MLPSYLPSVQVNTFGIIGSILAITFIAFWGVTPCNLLHYMSVVVEYVD